MSLTPNESIRHSRIDAFLEKHERTLILVLCVVAAFRVFFFSAAFPFFNNVDEQFHFDMVHKYARGYLPRTGNTTIDAGSSLPIVLYDTPEYLHRAEEFSNHRFPNPLWKNPQRDKLWITQQAAYWQTLQNATAYDPPFYYLIAGSWLNLGKLIGIRGADLLYWIRFLNIPAFAFLVYLAYHFGRRFFPRLPSVWLGTPLLLTFFPQDVFYSINSDVFSPILVGGALYLLFSLRREPKSVLFYFLTGAAMAAAFLTKISNAVLAVPAGILLGIQMHRSQQKPISRLLPRWSALFLGVGIPMIAWLGCNYGTSGDALGTHWKAQCLRWTEKPFGEWWSHPLFTVSGFGKFITTLIASFWRGELVWGLEPIASRWADGFYVLSSALIFLLLAITLSNPKNTDPEEGLVQKASGGLLLSYLLFLIWISIRFDFGDCWYPSQDHPYFSSGRLMLGALVPFAILYTRGFALLCSKAAELIHPVPIIAAIAFFMMANEIAIHRPVFKSAYNWFHL